MLEAQHFTAAADRKGSYALPDEFDGSVNTAVLYQAVRMYLNNQRQGTASTKTRSEVTGGNRKPWRQKGTGRARQGTIRSPLWTGGGVVFGPRPRSYRTDVPRKVRQAARRSALNARAREGALYVVEPLSYEEPKTRRMIEFLGKLGVADKAFRHYDRLRQRKWPAALLLKGDNCPGCRIKIAPQTRNDIRKGEEIITCLGCERILYDEKVVAGEESLQERP